MNSTIVPRNENANDDSSEGRFFPVLLTGGCRAPDGTSIAEPLVPEDRRVLGDGEYSAFQAPVFAAGTATSTFDLLWDLERRAARPDWTSILAVAQTQGRGQVRRAWLSPPGNLHVSWLLPDGIGRMGGLASLAVGMLVAEALRDLEFAAQLKWPNDILLDDDGGPVKIAGILLEDRGSRLAAGLGLNLRPMPATAVDPRSLPAGRIDWPGTVLDVWHRLMGRMISIHEEMSGQTPAAWRERIQSILAWRGRAVLVDGQEGEITGVDEQGALLLRTPSGMERITSGSPRPTTLPRR